MTPVEAAGAFALLGLASTPHCAAMCGPLAVRACAGGRNRVFSPRSALAYGAGRTTSYVFLGALAGALGAHVVQAAGPSAGIIAAEMLAAMLLLEAIRLLGLRPAWEPRLFSRLGRVFDLLPRTPLGLGLANGFLPCGSLTAALVLAAAAGSALSAAAGMGVFALATAPGLAVAPLTIAFAGRAARAVGIRRRVWFPQRARSRAAGMLLAVLALWMAARPFLPPGVQPGCPHHEQGATATR
jgi:sulfite exporter TauE/SafE